MYEKSKSNWFGKAPKKLNLSFIDSVGESRFNFFIIIFMPDVGNRGCS